MRSYSVLCVLAVVLVVLPCACGGGSETGDRGPASGDGGPATEDAGPTAADGGREDGGSQTGDGGTDADNGGLAVPYMPPKPENPVIDVPYTQEYNHTTNEVEAGIGPLVAVVIPPASYTDFDVPTQITPRGFVRRKQGGGFDVVEIDAAHADLVGAAAGSGMFVLAGPQTLYFVDSNGSINSYDAPAGLNISGLSTGSINVYVATNKGVGLLKPGAIPEWPADGPRVNAVMENGGTLWIGSDEFVTVHQVPSSSALGPPEWTISAAEGLSALPVAALIPALTLPDVLEMVVVGAAGGGIQGIRVQNTSPTIVAIPVFAPDRVPLFNPRAAAKTPDGGFVVATAGGAYRIMDRGFGPEWRVYNQERWLPSEDVRGVAVDPGSEGSIWFATAGGLATVTVKQETIEDKLSPFVERIIARHDRDGAVADSHLTRRGDLSSNIPWDSDNDGSWTSYWLLAECFRFAVTGAADARAHFDKSLDRMLSLRELTGTDWFVARAVIRKDGCILDDCDNPDDGKWFTSPDGGWWVKRDTSNDEVIAHAFMMGHAYDLCADETQKERIRQHVAGIFGGIMDRGWQLIDPITNAVTTYGQLDPYYVNVNVSGAYGDGGVRSAEILAGLTLAHYMTGEQRFLDGKKQLIKEHHYDDNVENTFDYPFHQGNGDGDEMGTEAFFVLLRYESDPVLREKWLSGWKKTWENALSKHQAAWWTMVNAVVGGTGSDIERDVARWLKLAPADMIRWDIHNSHRRDLVAAPKPYKDGGMRSDGFIIPYDERRTDRWNTDQFRVDGGMGAMIEMDGADVLAPYWMARYYGFMVAE